jgi:dTMP kinase
MFIVIDGSDGSGKATQLKELIKHLKKSGVKTAIVDFPRYDKPASFFVREYLNGKYGSLKEMGPYKSSIFYALDRFDAASEIRKWLKEGRVVIANRYVSSNMAHQGAKILKSAERRKYFNWNYSLEYEIFGIPKPNLTIVLNVPATIAQGLVDKKGSREYIGGVKRDIHEANLQHLKRAEATYKELIGLYPKDFRLIMCVESKRLLSVPEVHEKVWDMVKKVIKKI